MLLWSGLEKEVRGYLSEQADWVYVIAPFINPQTLAAVLAESSADAIVVTSWRKDHLLSGVSSLKIYPLCQRNGWHLFVNSRVHMKVYSRDLTSALVGSANLTGAGLGDNSKAHHEVLCRVEKLNRLDQVRLQQLITQSRRVDDAFYKQNLTWLEAQPEPSGGALPEDVQGGPAPGAFLTRHLPLSQTPKRLWELANRRVTGENWEEKAMEHDLAMYAVSPDLPLADFLQELEEVFFRKCFIQAFLHEVEELGVQFGPGKQWIRNRCSDDPAPSARSLTRPMQALFRWFVFFRPGRYEITVPGRRAEVLQLRK